MHVRYLGIAGRVLPHEMFEEYIRLFPDRPFLPRVQSINTRTPHFASSTSLPWLRFLLHSSTPAAENQTSASTSTLKHIRTFDSLSFDNHEGATLLALDLVTFQHSNVMLGGGLESFTMGSAPCLSTRRPYQDLIEYAFVLPPPGTMDSPVHGLRHLEVPHFLRELPDFFGRVAKMHTLEHLIIVIMENRGDDNILEVEERERAQHSLSTLEIEGYWWHLSSAINLCSPPSPTVPFRTFCLHYYGIDRDMVIAEIARVIDLPTGIVPPDNLETLTIELLEEREWLTREYLRGLVLTTNELQPLLQYRQMVKLHLDLPCTISLDIKFFHELAAVMRRTLSHLVIMRAMEYRPGSAFKPGLTVDDLATIAGVILPRLETLGLDVTWCDSPLSAERDCLVASSLLRALYVGTERTLSIRGYWEVSKFLKDHFPGLQYVYHHAEPYDDIWRHVIKDNGYSGKFF